MLVNHYASWLFAILRHRNTLTYLLLASYRRLVPSDEVRWRFVQTPLCRWWCGPEAGKPWKVNPYTKEEAECIEKKTATFHRLWLSSLIAECRICDWEVAGLNLTQCDADHCREQATHTRASGYKQYNSVIGRAVNVPKLGKFVK